MRNRLPAAFSLDPRRFRDRRFWIVQVLVLALAASHALLEGRGDLPHSTSLYFVPETLFLIPVGYAALNFGLHGAVATAMWSTALALPNLFVFHQGDQFAAAATQLIIVIAVALFVGYRVEEERLARRRADAARDALAASERRYRGLFLNSTAAVVVFDRAGRIHEANPATTKLFGSADVIGLGLSDVVGSEASERLLAAPAAPHRPGAPRRDAPAGSGRAATAARDRGDAAVRRRHGSRHCEPGAVDYRGPHGLLARLYAPVASPRTGRAWRGHLSPPPGGRVP